MAPANAREAFFTAVPRLAVCLPARSVVRLSSVSRQSLKLTRRYAALDLVALPTLYREGGNWRRRFSGEAFGKLEAGPWRIIGVALDLVSYSLSQIDHCCLR